MEYEHARDLRKNMTDAERLLWSCIRRRQVGGVKFRRQAPIGQYIVDFASFEAMLVIELDGGQHVEQKEYDWRRSEWLSAQGFKVMRFWNHEVFEDLDAVLDVIWRELADVPPKTKHQESPPQRSEGEG